MRIFLSDFSETFGSRIFETITTKRQRRSDSISTSNQSTIFTTIIIRWIDFFDYFTPRRIHWRTNEWFQSSFFIEKYFSNTILCNHVRFFSSGKSQKFSFISSRMLLLLIVNIFLCIKLNQIDQMTDRLVQNHPSWLHRYT